MTSTNPIENILLLARRVRTQEGSKLYGRPIGSLINDDPTAGGGSKPQNATGADPKFSMPQNATPTGPKGQDDDSKGPTKTVTLERLKSLQRQVKQAMKVDDQSQVKILEKQFNEAVAAYGKDRPAAQVVADLSQPFGSK